MSFRFYPTFAIKPNLIARPGQFYLNGKPYLGQYYETYDGSFFTGANPSVGPSERLERSTNPKNEIKPQESILSYTTGKQFTDVKGNNYRGPYYKTDDGKYYTPDAKQLNPLFETMGISETPINNSIKKMKSPDVTKKPWEFSGQPTSYQPTPLTEDYFKGYFNRYFVRRANDRGYIVEISEEEYTAINNGAVKYNIKFYRTAKLMWKLTGSLQTKRVSQYDIREGIIDTNKRLVETLEKTFVGIKVFIGENYSKFAQPDEITPTPSPKVNIVYIAGRPLTEPSN
jgi:hypothetical protein